MGNQISHVSLKVLTLIFRVVGEEQEGWVKVKRISVGGTLGSAGQLHVDEEEEEEGYIPIAFTEPV